MRKLTPAPPFKSLTPKAYIDTLIKTNFSDEKQVVYVRSYFYRTRLNLTPQKVAQMLDISELMVNSIAKDFGENKPSIIIRLESNLDVWFSRETTYFYRDRLNMIQKRIRNRNL